MNAFASDSSNQETFSPNQRLSSAQRLAILALHDSISIADKSGKYTTYQQILDMADELAPDFFGRLNLLERERESELAIEYRQKADVESLAKNEKVLPSNIVRRDIETWKNYLQGQRVEDRDAVVRRRRKLEDVLMELEPRPFTENRLIARDMAVGADLPYISKDVHYLDLALPKGRILRLRLIHPDTPEGITGVDILYEHHHVELKKVRLAAVQYKIWKKQTLYTSESDVEKQVEKLRCFLCANGLCDEDADDNDRHLYRMKYCAAFLRPTNKLQDADTRFASIGYHVPVCRVEELWEETLTGKRLSYERIKNESLTQRAFEELFCNEMLGSRWIPYPKLEDLYHRYNVLRPDDTAIIYAQDFVRRNR